MEGHTDTLDYFSPPRVDVSRIERHYIKINPHTSIMPGSPIVFMIPKSPRRYLDFSRTKLCVKLRILNANGTNITADNDVTLANHALYSIWRQIEVYCQESLVYNLGPHASLKGYLDVLLNNKDSPENYHLQSCLYKNDEGPLEVVNAKAVQRSNPTLMWRNSFTKLSKPVDLEGLLPIDLAEQNRVLLDNLQWSIKLWPQSDKVCLMSGDEDAAYRVEIMEAFLNICSVSVADEIYQAQMTTLLKSPAMYYLRKSDIRPFSLSAGISTFQIENVYQGAIPEAIILVLMSSTSYMGSYSTNPWFFDHCNLSEVTFVVDGKNRPSNALTTDFANDLFMSAYSTVQNGRRACFINRRLYPKGYAIYEIDLADHSSEYLTVNKTGHTRLDLRFSTPLQESKILLLYARFPTIMEIDHHRTVKISG